MFDRRTTHRPVVSCAAIVVILLLCVLALTQYYLLIVSLPLVNLSYSEISVCV